MTEAEIQERLTGGGYMLKELDEIASDVRLWAMLHGKVRDLVTRDPVPFVPRRLQRRLFDHYQFCKASQAPFRVVMCKVRRGGGSTASEAVLYCHAHNYNARLGAIGTDDSVSSNMFDFIDTFDQFDDFPGWNRCSKRLTGVGELKWPNGSSWEKYSAANPEAARSAGLQGYHACVPGETLVIVADGRLKRIDAVQRGDKVLTHTGEVATVVATVGRPCQKPMVRVTPWLSQAVDLTTDHKIPTRRGLIAAGELHVGDEVSMPLRQITEALTPTLLIRAVTRQQGGGKGRRTAGMIVPKNRETGFFFGYYLAEGHAKNSDGRYSQLTFARHRSEARYSDRAAAAVSEYCESVRTQQRPGCLTDMVHVYGAGLAALVAEHFGAVSTKHVPDWVFEAGPEFCEGLLDGYLSGDGSKTVPDCKANGRLNRVSANTIHASIATQIRDLAASLGYGWAAMKRLDAGARYGRTCKEAWRLEWNGDGAKRLAQMIGGEWVNNRRRHSGDTPKWRVEDDRVWLKVRKIEETDCPMVWDMEVDHDDHTFRTAWFSVANSEVGRWPSTGSLSASETLKSMLGAVPKRGFTVALEESTAQGATGAFYARWRSARWPTHEELGVEMGQEYWRKWEDETPQNLIDIGRQLQFVRIFAGWFEDEENAQPVSEPEIEYLERSLDQKEKRLIERYGCTGPQGRRLGDTVEKATVWEQLAWRRSVIESEFDGDVEGFEQEYPSGPKEAFASSGRHSFNVTGATWMVQYAKSSHPERGVLSEQHDGHVVFTRAEESDAWLDLWEAPRQGFRYIIGLDTMEGAEQIAGSKVNDYHAGIVVRASYVDDDGVKHPHKIVAALAPCSIVEADVLAGQIDLLSRWYGRCLVVPEINRSGYGYLAVAKQLGTNLYRRERTDRFTSELTDIVGWLTDDKTRPQLISAMQVVCRNNAQEATREDGLECCSLTLASECATMIKNAKGKDEAASGCHDDHVLACGMALVNISAATYFAGVRRHRRGPSDRRDWRRR